MGNVLLRVRVKVDFDQVLIVPESEGQEAHGAELVKKMVLEKLDRVNEIQVNTYQVLLLPNDLVITAPIRRREEAQSETVKRKRGRPPKNGSDQLHTA